MAYNKYTMSIMRIVKRSAIKDDKAKTVFEVFDRIIVKMTYPWKFDVIELLMDDKNSLLVNDDAVSISINYNDPIVQDKDKKGITALILHNLYHIISRDKYNLPELPHFIEDAIANREMIANGLDDLVFYMSYLFLLRKRRINNIEGYLGINTPWLSFYKLDNYNTEFLKSMLIKIKNRSEFEQAAKKLIEAMKKDLREEKNLNYAINAYEVMLCR